MPNVSAFSDTRENALKELAVAWKGVKESYHKHNEPIPQAPARSFHINPYAGKQAQLHSTLNRVRADLKG